MDAWAILMRHPLEAHERFGGRKMTERYLEIYRRSAPLGVQRQRGHRSGRSRRQDRGNGRQAGFYWNRVYGLTTAAHNLSRAGRRLLALRVMSLVLRTAPRSLPEREAALANGAHAAERPQSLRRQKRRYFELSQPRRWISSLASFAAIAWPYSFQ